MFINPTKSQEKIYKILLGAHALAMKIMKPEVELREVYNSISDFITESDSQLSANIPNNFGFGLGLEFKEASYIISKNNPNPIKKGHTNIFYFIFLFLFLLLFIFIYFIFYFYIFYFYIFYFYIFFFLLGMVFNLSLGLENLEITEEEQSNFSSRELEKRRVYSVLIADTVLIEQNGCLLLTKTPKESDDITYNIKTGQDDIQDDIKNLETENILEGNKIFFIYFLFIFCLFFYFIFYFFIFLFFNL